MSNEKEWMDELKKGTVMDNPIFDPDQKECNRFHGTFKFSIGEKVYSRIHECKGIVEYSEMTRFITGDQISYKVRFNDPEDVKTEISAIDEEWLDKV